MPPPIRPAPRRTRSVCTAATSTPSSQAQEAGGATVREPVQTFVTGDRFASIVDPFGTRWSVMTRVEEVSPEERERRLSEWAKENVAT